MHSPPDVRHVHEVLQDYNLLNIALLQDKNRLDLPRAKAWRMNLCAASEEEPGLFFVAMDYSVLVYRIDHFSGSFGRPIKQLICHGDDLDELNSINQLKVSRIFEHEALVTVNNSGEVWIWRTDQLDRDPIILNNDHSSTWGLAIHSDQGLIGVSANNWRVTVFNMHNITASNRMFGKRRSNIRPVIDDDKDRIHLIGHTHNVPCVDFNRTGRFIASCSIDQTCRIWDIKTAQQVSERQIMISRRDSDSWCWSVKFVTVADFKDTVCMDDRLCENISRRMANGRSTSLSSLHLRPSAPLPVYRVNLPGLGQADVTVGITDSEESYDEDYYEDGVTDEDLMHYSDEESFAPAAMLRQLELSDEWRQQRNMALQRWNNGEPAELDEEEDDDSVAEGPTEDEDEEDDQQDGDENSPITTTTPALAETEIENEQHDDELSQQHHEDDDDDVTMTLPEDLPASTTWDPHSDYDSDWFEEDDGDDNVIFMLPGANGGHRLLSPAEHRILRDRLIAERGPFNIRTTPNVQPIPVSTKGGWSDNSEDEDENNDQQSQTTHDALEESEEEDKGDQQSKAQGKKRRILAHTMRSSNVAFHRKKRRSYERLMLTTPKDLFMLKTSKGRMMTERMERNVISSVDVRSDRLLVAMDRLNMVQWIPSLELYIAASQKGTVALLRILQVKLADGQHTPIFNHERYLPDHDMQRRPLYGMSCCKISADGDSFPVYVLHLFYCDGAVLGYRLSRQNDELFADPILV